MQSYTSCIRLVHRHKPTHKQTKPCSFFLVFISFLHPIHFSGDILLGNRVGLFFRHEKGSTNPIGSLFFISLHNNSFFTLLTFPLYWYRNRFHPRTQQTVVISLCPFSYLTSTKDTILWCHVPQFSITGYEPPLARGTLHLTDQKQKKTPLRYVVVRRGG